MRRVVVKVSVGAAALAALGIGAGAASADLTVPTPTVPTPTVPTPTVPQVTVPKVTVPKLPSTPPPPKVSAPTVHTSSPSVPSVSSGGGTASSGGTSGGSSSYSYSGSSGSYSTGSAASQASTAAARPTPTKLRAHRKYVALHGRNKLRLTFFLPTAGTVVLVVQEVSPVCRIAGTIRVRGRRGANTITFRPRVSHRTLEPGTYRVASRRAFRRGSHGVTVVVVESGTPSAAEVAAARVANACVPAAGGSAYSPGGNGALGSGSSGSGASGGSGGASGANGGAPFRPHSNGGSSNGGSGNGGNGNGSGSVQAAGYTPTSATGTSWIRPLLLAGVALATLLLALAAMPEAVARTSRFGEVVAHRRLSLALAGAATLVAFALAYAVSI